MKIFFRSFKEALSYQLVTDSEKEIVFYSEGGNYAPYLRPIIEALSKYYEGTVYYLTSDDGDQLLIQPPSHVRSYYIGKGEARTFVLNNLTAKLVVMTMPDINSFHIKRSQHANHYAYIQHSLVSTHMVYRKGAFDFFDSVFCAGPYQIEETREWEDLFGLKAKELVEHGYAPLDELINIAKKVDQNSTSLNNKNPSGGYNVIVAPSWGPQGLMENHAEQVVGILLHAGHVVHVRPHPRTRQLSGQVLDALERKFADHPHFDMSEDITTYEPLLKADVMISDWSGVAMEFAFGLEKPVLFVDVPRKINNTEYEAMNAVPLEISYRDEIGKVISLDRVDELPAVLDALRQNSDTFRSNIPKLREKYFFNIGTSAEQGAAALADIVFRQNI